MNTHIRKVKRHELVTLLNFSRQTFFDAFETQNSPDDMSAYASTNFTIEKITSEFNTENSQFYFAFVHDDLTGYLKINTREAQTEFKGSDSLEVERIYVLANQQGKRIGEQLLRFATDKAVALNCKFIWLGVWEKNHNAIRFYERHGFAAFSSHPFMLGSDQQIDILMRKDFTI